MFKKATQYTSLAIGFLSLLWLLQISVVRESDKESYASSLQKTKELATSHESISSSKQHRAGVRKDLWLTQADKTRLHTRIDSESSIVTLLPSEDKVDIIENLDNLKCWMQDRITSQDGQTMQQMRYFVAKSGTYQYSSGLFLADQVAISVFRLPGSNLQTLVDPKKAFLKGIAKSISFSVEGKGPQFQAEAFQAMLNTEETVR
jgi:hypothetical protein